MTLPSLTDNIGRLTITMKNVKETASVINRSSSYNHSGLFSRSVLATPLGDLIRDIDPSELGLFTLVPQTQLAPPRDITHAGPPPEIARIEVVSATPLRKHSAQRKDAPIHFKDPEPEVFAEAALKYIDRYAHIRPMPRVRSQVTEMLEYLHQLREGIHSLSDSLKNMETSPSTSDSLSPKSLIAREEMRLHDLQARISHLKKRKEALQNNRVVAFAPMETKPSGSPEFLNSAVPDPQEDSFWTTPGARRTLQFKNELLVDEDVDLANVTSSFSSPVVSFKPSALRVPPTGSTFHNVKDPTECMVPEHSSTLENTFDRVTVAHDNQIEDHEQVGDYTKIVEHHPVQPSPRSLPVTLSEPNTPVRNTERLHPSSTEELGPQPQSVKKVRITNDVERIVSKIWSTVGELIMPGNPFTMSGSDRSRPPRAKETIAHLHTLAAQDPIPTSPSTSSLSSVAAVSAQSPTTQQILTAHLLLALLEAAPHFALSLARVKEILGAKESMGVTAIGSGAAIRVLYGCVAKRLIRIDRGGGEQTVRFDV